MPVGRLKRYTDSLRPPIRIVISSTDENEYQELKADSTTSGSPSPRTSDDDYHPYNENYSSSLISQTPSNEFANVSDLLWLKVKIRNRTIFSASCPRLIPRLTRGWGQSTYTQRKRRCTRRQYIVFVVTVMLLVIVTFMAVAWHVIAARGGKVMGYELPGANRNDLPLWETTFEPLKFNYGGLKELVPKNENIPEWPPLQQPVDVPTTTTFVVASPTQFHAYPEYTSDTYQQEYRGKYVPCRSFIDGEVLDASNPLVRVYDGIPFRM
ncbi:hypothetical protein ABW21_db0205253 [Orbilia brochopaga]|nr:hypothetical protein ABW21_db0205253 [Drechslerella brochopaga]